MYALFTAFYVFHVVIKSLGSQQLFCPWSQVPETDAPVRAILLDNQEKTCLWL